MNRWHAHLPVDNVTVAPPDNTTLMAAPMPAEASAELPMDEPPEATPTVSVGLSLETFHTVCVKHGKSTVAIAKALECVPADVGRRVKAMSPVELGVLADELGIEWGKA